MGEQAFTRVQYGIEATRGTPVAATGRLLLPTAKIKLFQDRKIQSPDESLGLRTKSKRTAVYQILGDSWGLQIDDGYYQALPFLYSIFMKGGVSPTQTGSDGDWKYDFTPSLSASNAINSATIEIGDDVQAYKMEYCMCKQLTIAGKVGGDSAQTIQAQLFNRQITPGTFTAALSNPAAPEPIIANNTKIYQDPTWAALGSTLLSGLIIDYSIVMLNGVSPRFHAGSKIFDTHVESFLDFTATFTVEGNATAYAIFQLMQAQTPKAIQVITQGSQIDGGTNFQHQINMFGYWSQVIPLASNSNGSNFYSCVFSSLTDDLATPHSLGAIVTSSNSTP